MIQEEWEVALKHLLQANAIVPGSIGSDLIPSVYERLNQTHKAEKARSAASSASLFELADPRIDALSADCYDPYCLSLAAGRMTYAGNPSGAVPLLERAIALRPKEAELRHHLAAIYIRQNKANDARKQLETALRYDSRASDCWALLANLYRAIGDTTNADNLLRQGIENCPESAGLRLGLARRLQQLGRREEAAREYEAALKLHIEEPGPYLELAGIYFRLQRVDEGTRMLEKALDAEPVNTTALAGLAIREIERMDAARARYYIGKLERYGSSSGVDIEAIKKAFSVQFQESVK
jgi:Tfp pilus assembly protein PilF